MPAKFWMVKGKGPTSAVHGTEKSAVAEAKRLARVNPGETFAVLEASRAFVKADVVEVDLREDDDIPFWPPAA